MSVIPYPSSLVQTELRDRLVERVDSQLSASPRFPDSSGGGIRGDYSFAPQLVSESGINGNCDEGQDLYYKHQSLTSFPCEDRGIHDSVLRFVESEVRPAELGYGVDL